MREKEKKEGEDEEKKERKRKIGVEEEGEKRKEKKKKVVMGVYWQILAKMPFHRLLLGCISLCSYLVGKTACL